jgi:hypothetical protein
MSDTPTPSAEFNRAVREAKKQAGEVSDAVPSGMRLEFGGGISGNMRLSFQAARSIG